MPTERYNEAFPIVANINLVQGSGTNLVQSTPICSVLHRFDAARASSTAAADHDVRLSMLVNSVSYPLGSVTIPAGAGYTTVPAVDLIAALVTPPNDGIVLAGGSLLHAKLEVALGAGETITIACVGGYF